MGLPWGDALGGGDEIGDGGRDVPDPGPGPSPCSDPNSIPTRLSTPAASLPLLLLLRELPDPSPGLLMDGEEGGEGVFNTPFNTGVGTEEGDAGDGGERE